MPAGAKFRTDVPGAQNDHRSISRDGIRAVQAGGGPLFATTIFVLLQSAVLEGGLGLGEHSDSTANFGMNLNADSESEGQPGLQAGTVAVPDTVPDTVPQWQVRARPALPGADYRRQASFIKPLMAEQQFRASGLTGIEPMPSQSRVTGPPLSP